MTILATFAVERMGHVTSISARVATGPAPLVCKGCVSQTFTRSFQTPVCALDVSEE
jgi:hypothetical protein